MPLRKQHHLNVLSIPTTLTEGKYCWIIFILEIIERRYPLTYILFEFYHRTTMAIAGDDYAIVGGCTRMSTGYEILSRTQSKLFDL
jgi:hypothetical protein